MDGEIWLGVGGRAAKAHVGTYPAITVRHAFLTTTMELLVLAEHEESLFSPPGLSPHCCRKGSSRKWNLPRSWDFLKETKHDLMKSRLILLFHFPFRKGGGRIVIWSIWFHICSRNYPRHKSTFLLSILKHPRELLLQGTLPAPTVYFMATEQLTDSLRDHPVTATERGHLWVLEVRISVGRFCVLLSTKGWRLKSQSHTSSVV